MHCFIPPGHPEGVPLRETGTIQELYMSADDTDELEDNETPIYEENSKLVHRPRPSSASSATSSTTLISTGTAEKEHHKLMFSIAFIKKYLLYAKNRVVPELSEEAATFISQSFGDLRAKEDMKTLPVTARTLETMIRLSTAHAKARLSYVVTQVEFPFPVFSLFFPFSSSILDCKTQQEDARIALQIMNFALYHEANATSLSDQPEIVSQQPDQQSISIVSSSTVDTATASNDGSASKRVRMNLAPERIKQFSTAMVKFIQNEGSGCCSVDQIQRAANVRNSLPFSKEEALAILNHLNYEQKIYFNEGTVSLV